MLLILITCFILYWLLLSLFAFYNVRNIFKYYSTQPRIQIKNKWKGILRSDFGKWNQKAILIGCFTRFPYHVAVLSLFLISSAILIPLSIYLGRGRKLCIKIIRLCGTFGTRQVCNLIQPINYLQYKIQTPIVICNHVNWFDVWFVGITFLPISIVSKAIIKRTPILGTIGDYFQTIYVQRNSQNQRSTIAEQINQRVQKYMKEHNKNKNRDDNQFQNQRQVEETLPLIIFPEGTTSNGKSIMTFKAGAFNALCPITIFSLKYNCQQFQMGMGDVDQFQHVFISLCLKPTLQVNHRILYPLEKQTAQQYCERCRNIMSQMTGYQKVQCGYRDSVDYQNTMMEERKKKKIL